MKINTYMVLKDIFNSIDCDCFEGYYIAKINFARIASGVETSSPSYKKIDRRNIIILKSYELLADSAIYEIHITYFKPLDKKEASINCLEVASIESKAKSTRDEMIVFDKMDMKWFYDNCNDSNSIHYGKNPVIPALLILKKVDSYLDHIIKASSSVSIKFYEPIYLLDNLYIKYIDNIEFKLFDECRSIKQNKLIIHGVK